MSFSLDLALKAAAMYLIAWLVSVALGSRRSSARSAVWNACTVALALLPLAALIAPRHELRWLPAAPAVAAVPPPPLPVPGSSPAAIDAFAATRGPASPAPVLSAGELTAPAVAASLAPSAAPVAAASPASRPIAWRAWAIAFYLAGVAFFAVRLARSLFTVAWLRRTGFALESSEWMTALEKWRRTLGIHRPVRLTCTSRIHVPVAIGWLRPQILVPPSLLRSRARKCRDAVLVHELAHVRRADFAWQVLLELVRAAYWLHPIAWLLRRSSERAREEACDDVSVYLLRGSRRYPNTLLRVARSLVGRPHVAPGIAMARSTDLASRLRRIASGCRAPVCQSSWRTRVLAALLFLAVAGAAGALELARDRGTPPLRMVEVQVVHAVTGAPVEDVRVTLWQLGAFEVRELPRTDAQGTTRGELHGGETWPQTTFAARKAGFVPVRNAWSLAKHGRLPGRLTMRLEPAVPGGGIVRDTSGAPVAGGRIKVWSAGEPYGERVDLFDDVIAVTGPDGRWRTELLPGNLERFHFRLQHPSYLVAQGVEKSPETLRAFADEWTLKPGALVEGRVLDARGQPLAGASVEEGTAFLRFPTHPDMGRGTRLVTDAGGRFAFRCAAPGEFQVTVQAPGHAPAMATVQVGEAPVPPLAFRLERGQAIHGRIVDPSGRAVAGARVEAMWRRSRTLDWTAETDTAGRFSWLEAPADMLFFRVTKSGYRPLDGASVVAGSQEQVLQLTPQLRVWGRVTHAATGAPVERFRVVPGTPAGAGFHWERQRAVEFSGGQLDIILDETRNAFVLRLEADGCFPAVSRVFDPVEGLVAEDFALDPADDLRAAVVDAAGRPTSDADVYVLGPNQRHEWKDGAYQGQSPPLGVRTLADGAFRLSAQDGAYSVLITHESGCLLLAGRELEELIERGEKVVLEPWGRLEGTLRRGGQATPGATVELTVSEPSCHLHLAVTATTDAAGRFAWERLLPGRGTLGHVLNLTPKARRAFTESGCTLPVEIEPGKTARVELGGQGTTVAGRLVKASASTGDVEWSAGLVRLSLVGAERKPEAHHVAAIDDSGAFKVDDVPPGEYRFTATVYDDRFTREGFLGQELAVLKRQVDVPAGASGLLALGDLEVMVHRRVAEGQLAPDFSVAALDGGTIRLEELRGKVVLLEFWATWCGPCRGQLEELKDVAETFAGDDRFAIVGLSLDEDPETPRRYARQNGFQWRQGFLGKWEASKVREQYGVAAIPYGVLIGADGKVIRKNVYSPGLKQYVAKLLAEMGVKP